MNNAHAQRSKGSAGLAFVVLVIATAVLMGAPPVANANASDVSTYLSTHRSALLIASWLGFPTGAFFLWFVVGMSQYLRRLSRVDEGLPTFALGAGIWTVAMATVSVLIVTALVFAPATDQASLPVLWGLQTLASGAMLSMALAVFVFAVAHSMRRHQSAPGWLAWLGYLTGAGQVVMTFGMFYPSGLATGNLWAGLILGLVLFLIWMIAVSWRLISEGSQELAGTAPSPA